jgi:hypothetical protein
VRREPSLARRRCVLVLFLSFSGTKESDGPSAIAFSSFNPDTPNEAPLKMSEFIGRLAGGDWKAVDVRPLLEMVERLLEKLDCSSGGLPDPRTAALAMATALLAAVEEALFLRLIREGFTDPRESE